MKQVKEAFERVDRQLKSQMLANGYKFHKKNVLKFF